MKRMTSDLDSREVVREMRSGFNHWTDPESAMEEVEEEVEEMVEEVMEDIRVREEMSHTCDTDTLKVP